MEKTSEKKPFTVRARAQSFRYALRGIGIIFKTQHNAWLHGVSTVIVVVLGFWLHISEVEWAVILLSVTSVLAAEAFNTAVEIDINLTSPDFHPFARDTKDVASGAVLITALGAALVGIVIFIPKVLFLLV